MGGRLAADQMRNSFRGVPPSVIRTRQSVVRSPYVRTSWFICSSRHGSNMGIDPHHHHLVVHSLPRREKMARCLRSPPAQGFDKLAKACCYLRAQTGPLAGSRARCWGIPLLPLSHAVRQLGRFVKPCMSWLRVEQLWNPYGRADAAETLFELA